VPEYSCRNTTGPLKVPCWSIPAEIQQAPLRFHAGVFLQKCNRPP